MAIATSSLHPAADGRCAGFALAPPSARRPASTDRIRASHPARKAPVPTWSWHLRMLRGGPIGPGVPIVLQPDSSRHGGVGAARSGARSDERARMTGADNEVLRAARHLSGAMSCERPATLRRNIADIATPDPAQCRMQGHSEQLSQPTPLPVAFSLHFTDLLAQLSMNRTVVTPAPYPPSRTTTHTEEHRMRSSHDGGNLPTDGWSGPPSHGSSSTVSSRRACLGPRRRHPNRL